MRSLPPLKKYWLLQLLLTLQILPLSLLLLLPPPYFGYGALVAVGNAGYVVVFVLNRIGCKRCGFPIGRSYRMLGHPGRWCKQCGTDLWNDHSRAQGDRQP